MSIQVRDLTYIYNVGLPDQQTALDDVSFDIYDDDIVGIAGHTGSGKSTLLQQLNGLLKPTSGTIIVDGIDITKPKTPMAEIRKKVGLVFQYPEYQLFEETVAADVAFGPKNLGLPQDEIDGRVNEALELVGIDPGKYGKRSPFDLSGGQKRRVAIAGVIAMKPKVLILDEPTAGLDPAAHRDIMDMIQNVHERERNITIFASHDMDDIARLCNKVMVMNRGRLVTMGTPEKVFSQHEVLKHSGIDVPSASKILMEIKKRGAEIDTDALDIDSAVDRIMSWIGQKNARAEDTGEKDID
jgi:energy-coupling factor transport system ATP-binding protein